MVGLDYLGQDVPTNHWLREHTQVPTAPAGKQEVPSGTEELIWELLGRESKNCFKCPYMFCMLYWSMHLTHEAASKEQTLIITAVGDLCAPTGGRTAVPCMGEC